MRKFSLVSHLVLIVLVAINLQSCGSIQQMIYGTPTPTFTNTPTFTATSTVTPSPTFTPTPTLTPNFIATQKAGEFSEIVSDLSQKFSEAAFLNTVYGEYHSMDDSTLELAKKGYIKWMTSPVKVKNFLLRTHLKMSTANKRSNETGCGFVFQASATFNRLIIIQQDGYLTYSLYGRNVFTNYSKNLDNPVELDVILIANGRQIQMYINGKKDWILDILSEVSKGNIGYAVQSGSNVDYGSQCVFTNTDLWEIKTK